MRGAVPGRSCGRSLGENLGVDKSRNTRYSLGEVHSRRESARHNRPPTGRFGNHVCLHIPDSPNPPVRGFYFMAKAFKIPSKPFHMTELPNNSYETWQIFKLTAKANGWSEKQIRTARKIALSYSKENSQAFVAILEILGTADVGFWRKGLKNIGRILDLHHVDRLG